MKQSSRTGMARAGKTDGRLFGAQDWDVAPGTVLRMVTPSDGSVPAFSDFVVTKVFRADEHGVRLRGGEADLPSAGRVLRMSRPYGYATSTGGFLTGVETIDVPESRVIGEGSPFKVVVQSTGAAASYLT